MTKTRDMTAIVVGALALASTVWTVGSGVVPTADVLTAILVPTLFVVAGLLGPLWGAARFVSRVMVSVGAAHLFAFALSAVALSIALGVDAWHVLSQILFVAGFALLVPLAVGYPGGPAPRWAWDLVVIAGLVPVLAGLSGPTPTVLESTDSAGDVVTRGPIADVLPQWVAQLSTVVFALPLAAIVVAVIRLARGDRELRGRLTLPLAALAAFAVAIVLGSLLPEQASAISTALFLLSAPLVPVALIAGSRPITSTSDETSRLLREAQESAALAALTMREREVLAHMAAGESNAAIAGALHISLSAVEKHTTAIFSKLGLDPEPGTHRRVAAVVAYLRGVSR